MSHQHMLIFAGRLADAFLFGDNDRQEGANAELRARSKRAGAASITTTETEAPADSRRWVDRRAMKRAR